MAVSSPRVLIICQIPMNLSLVDIVINLGLYPERGTSIRNEERVSGTRNEYPERGTSIRNEERVSGTRNEDPERGVKHPMTLYK